MLTLITITVFGIIFAYFATQNTTGVNLMFGGSVWSLPLYGIALGSLLLGFFISWIISSLNSISSWMTLQGSENKLKKTQRTVEELESTIHDLELENAKLKGENKLEDKEIVETERVVEVDHKPTFFEKLRHNLSV